ncbi:MAG: hypothetical protein Q9183_000950, partial [Haloplaca sp. 2 TL-2023]
NGYYIADISLGTPPQNVRLVVDTGSSDMWCNHIHSQLCQSGRCIESGTYDANASSTYEYIGSTFNITYAPQNYARGDHATETVRIGDIELTKMQFGIGYDSSSSHAILGLGYHLNEARSPFEQFKTYRNMPLQLLDQGHIRSLTYSIWLDDLETDTGVILFGALDTEKFEGDLQTVPLIQNRGQYTAFLVSLTGLKLSGNSFSHGLPVPLLLDTGAPNSILPRSLTDEIMAALNIKYDIPFDCDQIKPDKSLEFSFGNVRITVPISEMIMPQGEKCAFGIVPGGEGGGLLGDTFLRSAYIVYDLGNNQVHMAQTKFGNRKTHIMEILPGPWP